MSIRITVSDAPVRQIVVTTKRGEQLTLHKQHAWAHLHDRQGNPEPYPTRIELTLDRDNPQPYPPGEYTLAPSSFYVGSFGSLECSPRLMPIKARG